MERAIQRVMGNKNGNNCNDYTEATLPAYRTHDGNDGGVGVGVSVQVGWING